MKRIGISIQSRQHPDQHSLGYALTNEVGSERLSFFSSQKFKVDEELDIICELNGEKALYKVVMGQLHEQISSGRIMTAVPSEENPFPALTFYRCYAKVLSKIAMTGPKAVEDAPAGENAAADGAPAEVVAATATPAAEVAATETSEPQAA